MLKKINKKLEECEESVRTDYPKAYGTYEGIHLGLLFGLISAATLPLWFGRFRDGEKEDLEYLTELENKVVSAKEKNEHEYRLAEFMAETYTTPLARWLCVSLCVVDWADAKPEIMGYLAIPNAISLIYETYNHFRQGRDK